MEDIQMQNLRREQDISHELSTYYHCVLLFRFSQFVLLDFDQYHGVTGI